MTLPNSQKTRSIQTAQDRLENPFRYQAFGLTIESSLPCPELTPAKIDKATKVTRSCDVTIIEVPLLSIQARNQRGDQWFSITDGVLNFEIQEIGRFEVSNGRMVRFARDPNVAAPGVQDNDIRVFLLGSCMGAILQQRHQLTLHASTAAFADKSVVVMGKSGAGKSSTLGMLMSGGWEMLNDDVTTVRFENEMPFALPAYGQMKLNLDSADRLQIDSKRLQWINRFKSKLALRCPERLRQSNARIDLIIALDIDEHAHEIRIEPLSGAAKFALVHQNLYRPAFIEGFGLQAQVMNQVAKLVNHCRVYRIVRPGKAINTLQAVLNTIEKLGEQ